MTLEDFFTLSEIKDGLTAISRVEELVSVMQKERNSVVKNVGEAARQWSTVAITLSATKSKDCLDLFIRLDGLKFLNHWLQDAHKYSNGICDNSVEESIAALLGALKKLPIDTEISISSGIVVTVKALFGQKSFSIRDRAKALSDSWGQGKDNDGNNLDVEKGERSHDNEVLACEVDPENVSSFKGSSGIIGVDSHEAQLSQGEFQHSITSESSQSESEKDVKIPISPKVVPSISSSEGTTSTQIHSPKENFQGESSGVAELKGFTDDAHETDTSKGRADNFVKKENQSFSTSLGAKCASSASNPSVQLSVMKPDVWRESDAEKNDFSLKKNSPLGLDIDVGTLASEPKTDAVNSGLPGGECCSNDLADISSNECGLRKPEGSKFSLLNVDGTGVLNDAKLISNESISKSDRGDDSVILGNLSGPTRDSKDSGKINQKYEMDFDYGIDDSLELAWQVAKQVEREVVGYREPFCSTSSEKNSEGGVMLPDSPNSINGEEGPAFSGPQNEVPAGQNLLGASTSLKGKRHLLCSKNTDIKPEDRMQDPESSSQVTEATPEPASNTSRGLWGFDLNQEILSEEIMEHHPPKSISSAPILVVPSSRSVTVPGLPVTPLYFEGISGWEGSAATSAFRPASSRKAPDCEKTLSKQRRDTLDFDLNVLVSDDGVTDPILPTLVPISLNLPSGESSLEVSSRKAARINLDLNLIGDNDDAPSSDWKMDGGASDNHRDGYHSPSSALSSSSSRQLSMKDIDLNDSPSFFDSNDQQLNLGKSLAQEMNPYVGFKLRDPEIVPQTQSFLPNGLMPVTRSGGSVGQRLPVTGYTPSPHFGYNSIGMGPTMSLSPAMYGSSTVPCIVDLRGTPGVPQMMGSPAAVQPSYSRSSPFVINMAGPSTGFNGLDLNSGLMMADSESRQSGVLRQFLNPGQGGIKEEQTRSMKRKEPDGGWDPYSMGYKQQQPWY